MSNPSPLDDRLQQYSKAQLIDLVHKMVDRHPALESLVDVVPDERASIDEATVRTFVRHAFDGVEGYGAYDYGYSRTVRTNLWPILDRGREKIEAGDWDTAATVFVTVSKEIRQRYGSFRDEEGELATVVDECTEALGTVLDETSKPSLREQIFRALLKLYKWDAENGGYGMASSVPEVLTERTTPEERQRMASWLRNDVPPASEDSPPADDFMSGASREWTPEHSLRERLGRLLLNLVEDAVDDEAYLALCRETGHVKKRIRRLLKLGRAEEAADTTSRLSDHAVSKLLDRFVDAGASATARSIAQSRIEDDDPSGRVARWLYEHARERDDGRLALHAARRAFIARPTVETAELVRTAAVSAGGWPRLRDRILEHLRDTSQHRTLARVLAQFGAIDEALQVVDDYLLADAHRTATHSVLRRVARAAEEDRPEGAAKIYDQMARGLIEDRGRKNYAEAATFMDRAKALFERKDRPGDWKALIDRLYEDELRSLPAARDEFEKVGLL
jgi:hypothetical protein